MLAFLAFAAAGSVYAATVGVSGVNFRYEPAARTIEVGDTVRWTFSGDPHTVTSGGPGAPDGTFSSGIKDAGTTYEFRFQTAGTFPYFCEIHPEQMTGTIVVTSEPEPTATGTPRPTATPRPTPRPTATPRPTPQPTATPRATATATATATAAATATATAASSETATPSPAASATDEPSATSSASASASASLAGQASASPTVVGIDDTAAGDLNPLPIVAGIAVLAVIAGGAYVLATRARRA